MGLCDSDGISIQRSKRRGTQRKAEEDDGSCAKRERFVVAVVGKLWFRFWREQLRVLSSDSK
jgi:hypothetical protein